MPHFRVVSIGLTDNDRLALEAGLVDSMPGPRSLTSVEAVAEIGAGRIDILVVDVMQPSHDVLALFRAAAETQERKRIPIIVTAPAEAAARVQACLERGADDYLTSPLDREQSLLVRHRISLVLARAGVMPASTAPKSDPTLQIPADAVAAAIARSPKIVDVPAQDVSERFVPRKFLEQLSSRTDGNLRLGDCAERDMSVLHLGIHDFTRFAESLTAQQSFNFLTSYFGNVTETVRTHGGFVEKYLGGIVLALFPGPAADAARCAVALSNKLADYNRGRTLARYVPIAVGIGVHRGRVALGTVGSDDHFQTAVISETADLTTRIQDLTAKIGAQMLLSGSVVRELPLDHTLRLRRLDTIRPRSKARAEELYECFDGDDVGLLEHKTRTAALFDSAMLEFRSGQYASAGRVFARIAEFNGRDSAALYFRNQCSSANAHGSLAGV